MTRNFRAIFAVALVPACLALFLSKDEPSPAEYDPPEVPKLPLPEALEGVADKLKEKIKKVLSNETDGEKPDPERVLENFLKILDAVHHTVTSLSDQVHKTSSTMKKTVDSVEEQMRKHDGQGFDDHTINQVFAARSYSVIETYVEELNKLKAILLDKKQPLRQVPQLSQELGMKSIADISLEGIPASVEVLDNFKQALAAIHLKTNLSSTVAEQYQNLAEFKGGLKGRRGKLVPFIAGLERLLTVLGVGLDIVATPFLNEKQMALVTRETEQIQEEMNKLKADTFAANAEVLERLRVMSPRIPRKYERYEHAEQEKVGGHSGSSSRTGFLVTFAALAVFSTRL